MTETIKFNNELLKLLCIDDVDTGEKDNNCLITNIALEVDHVELICKHKFNYVSIFREICKQKESTKLESTHLKPNQVKCPYCRTIQTGLIPLNASYPHLKTNGVNIPERLVYKGKKCISIIKSGKRKGELCDKVCVKTTCNMHSKTNTPSVLCEAIIQTGKRKGLPCGARCIKDSNKVSKKCMRHTKFFKI
jgi:hypothetical protein